MYKIFKVACCFSTLVFPAFSAVIHAQTSGSSTNSPYGNAPDVSQLLSVGINSTSTSSQNAETALIQTVGTVVSYNSSIRRYVVNLNSGITRQLAISQLTANSIVEYACPVVVTQGTSTPNDTYIANQYSLSKARASDAWSAWQPIASVKVAVVDSGIDINHPDLVNVFLKDNSSTIVGKNFVSETGDKYGTTDFTDRLGHGTHVAGIIGAQVNNGIGVAGVAGWNGFPGTDTSTIKMMFARVIDYNNYGTTAWLADGITWAADNGAQVINVSVGIKDGSTTDDLGKAVKYAYSKGCVLCLCAGNNGNSTNPKVYPGAYAADTMPASDPAKPDVLKYPSAISVGSTDNTDTLASDSGYGDWVQIAAPGVSILSTTPTYSVTFNFSANYGTLSGTSMATPYIAGEAALLLAQNPQLTGTQVVTLIKQKYDSYTNYLDTTDPNKTITHTLASGAGRANIFRAVLGSLGKIVGTPDVDGDGRADLLWESDLTGMISLWRTNPTSTSNPSGTPTKTVLYAPAASDSAAWFRWQIVGTPDLNGDGKSDVVFQNLDTGAIYYWILNSTYDGVANQGYIWNPTPDYKVWKVVGFGKINADNIPDVVLQNQTSNTVAAFALGWNGNAVSIISRGDLVTPPSGYKVVGVPFLGGNGSGGASSNFRSDLLLQNSSTGQLGAYFLGGNPISYDKQPATVGTFFTFGWAVGSDWRVVGTPKLNMGDFIDDVLWQNSTTGEMAYWLLNGVYGTGMFNSSKSLGVPTDPGYGTLANTLLVAGASPLDGDGLPDVIFQQKDTNAPYFWKLGLTANGSSTNSVTPQWMIARP